MKLALILTTALLALAGCASTSSSYLSAPAFTCHGQAQESSRRRQSVNVAVGQLELKRLPPETPPGPGFEDDEDGASSKKEPLRIIAVASLPGDRLRVVAEAVPLGSLGAALALELGVGVVVAPSLVDLRVSLALPDTRVRGLLRQLRRHYGVEYTFRQGVISLEDETAERLRRLDDEALFFHAFRLEGVSMDQVAAAWCVNGATSRGTAAVVWDMLLVTDTWSGLNRVETVIDALQKLHPPAEKLDQKDESEPGPAEDGEKPGGEEEPTERVAPVKGPAGREWTL